MAGLLPKLECRFYRMPSGHEPVRRWLLDLSSDERQEIGADIRRAQWRWPVGRPLVGTFGRGLYEVRSSLRGDIYRVLFCVRQDTMVLLHGFKKKTVAVPAGDLALARRRQHEVERSE
ncbi:MAG: type II toxin-antitoxin system RelE/ParE family toxin [bacterium]|nr:type II toxin-antitoxin system RelE/ParE family toxin [bacterium]